MKRIVLLAAMFLFVGAASAFAQTSQDATNAPAANGLVRTTDVVKSPVANAPSMFSKASIEKAVARSAATVPQTKKPFLKTPWPYVIAAAVVVILIIALRPDRAY